MSLPITAEQTQEFDNTPGEAVKHRYNTISRMSQQEMLDISFNLQKHHAIFNKFFTTGAPIFDMSLPTAAVYAERNTGRFLFMKINPSFWKSLSMQEKLFVISHECLHIILNHLTRLSNEENRKIINYAMDIVVNHLLVNKFGFKRSEIDPTNVYCWVDKFFKPEENIKTDETAEYYYHLLMIKHKNGELNDDSETVDGHDTISQEDLEDFIDQMDEFLTPDEKEYLKDMIVKHAGGESGPAGKGGGKGQWTFFNIRVKKKKKWETVIKKWALQTVGRKEKVATQWARLNRRFAFISKDIFLPSELESDEAHKEAKKIDVYFFLDTSGSCHHLGERFFSAAKSLPEERFNIRLFCFHDYVVETEITGEKVHLGGGTNFQIIEDYIQKLITTEGVNYPKAVFVITDGWGTEIHAEHPERYHWFLSEKTKTYIPKESYCYDLKDYE